MNPIANFVRNQPFLRNALRLVRGRADMDIVVHPKGYQTISLDYPFESKPRYGYGKPPHPKLYEIIERNAPTYRENLHRFLDYKESFVQIPLSDPPTPSDPQWNNEWFEGLDAVALYSFACMFNPKTYLEIGSGNSTKFIRKAITDHNLQTKVISIDPEPRAEIDAICDSVVREGAEVINLDVFDQLEAQDILFIDGSHRCFMNSDATSAFLDIIPKLKSGVLVHIHDIFLPYDYPPDWSNRYYSEQYLLAAYILAEGNSFDILLPNNFINQHEELSHVLDPLWNDPNMAGANKDAYSFWIVTK